MKIKNAIIKIRLRSDLCVASGYSFAGIIDSDAYYDEYGIPYIPARRIRGCLRDSATRLLYGLYDEEEINAVFGEPGQDYGSAFKIDNAYIEDYATIVSELKQLRGNDKNGQNNEYYGTQAILDGFSHIVGQTRINGVTGAADDASLRYTRVINKKSPITYDEQVFLAEISYDESGEELIRDAIRATRHIGLKRNRGLGKVTMEWQAQDSESKSIDAYIHEEELADGRKRLFYAVENVQPLMLSGNSEDSSVGYISGQQIIGLLAGSYLDRNGKSAEDEEFKHLFLNGDVLYSNLYPYDGRYIHYPAPDYVNCLKKTKRYVATLSQELPELSKDDPLFWRDGNQPKKLKGKFVSIIGDDKVSTIEIDKDIVYHHSHINTHETEDNTTEGVLYSLEVVRRGQRFAGSITGEAKYTDLVRNLLRTTDLYVGKSRSAQYGRCRLTDIDIKANKPSSAESSEGKADDIVVTFQSDAIIYNETGNPTVFRDEVIAALAKEIYNDNGTEVELSKTYLTGIQSGLVTGYLGVWNLRRPTIPVVKAGSFVTFKYYGERLPDIIYIGERNHEGYGQVSVDWASKYEYHEMEEISDRRNYDTCNGSDGKIIKDLVFHIKDLILHNIYERWLERKISKAINSDNKDAAPKVTGSTAGRMMLMLRECENEYGNDPDAAFRDFAERVCSIKSESARKEGERLLKMVGDRKDNEWRISSESRFMVNDDGLDKALAIIGESADEIKKKKLWTRYIRMILVNLKYIGNAK